MISSHARAGGQDGHGHRGPSEVVAALATGKRPPVRVTINGYTYRNTVALIGGRFMVGVSAEHRARAGVGAGDELDVDMDLDTEPRRVAMPADLARALDLDTGARARFDGLSYSN